LIYLGIERSTFEGQSLAVSLDDIDGEISKVLVIELLVFFTFTSLDALTFFFFAFFIELRRSGLESDLDGDVTDLLGQFDGVFFNGVSQSEVVGVEEFLQKKRLESSGKRDYLDGFVVGVVFFFELDFSSDGLGELLLALVDSGDFRGSHSSEESVGDLLVSENLVESGLKSGGKDLGQHVLWI